MIGQTISHYKIISKLGQGGQGEVYLAEDSRLGRKVALKILPEHLSERADLRERFEREARAVSSLNHPHICTLHDIGEQDGIHFLVMERLEGESLANRLEKGALPLEQTLEYAIQIADALDKAHRQGVVHRDLKPGNIMLVKSGAKLLDFGLAKLKATEATEENLSNLPTEQANLTAEGTILGTLQYMAPEQLEGKDTDSRTDIFAFGAVVYEMATGKKAFEGSSQASLIAAIMQSDPPAMSTLQPMTPSSLDRIVRTSLAKDPDDRWQAASDVQRQLQWLTETEAEERVVSAAPASKSSSPMAWVVLAVVTLFAVGMTVLAFWPGAQARELRLHIMTPAASNSTHFAISPDGMHVVFVATAESRSQLWLRALNSTTASPLSGTEGALLPFWSPDGQSVGFFADARLKRVDISGASGETLAAASSGRGAAWNRDGTILFAPTAIGPLFRVSANGGEPTVVTQVQSPQQTDHRFPQFLPDGRHFLYYARGTLEGRGVYVGDLDGAVTDRVVDADAGAVYASSGHLLFVSDGTLYAQDFDLDQLVLIGSPSPVVEELATSDGISHAAVSASSSGPFVYRTGTNRTQFVWFDRSGMELARVGEPDSARVMNPSLSPDGRRIALGRNIDGNWDIWLLDVQRGFLDRMTSNTAVDYSPVWSPDGNRLAFMSARPDMPGLYQTPPSGSSGDELISDSVNGSPTDWSPDGRFVLYDDSGETTGIDLWALSLDGDEEPFPVVQTNFDERVGQFSPDGRMRSPPDASIHNI